MSTLEERADFLAQLPVFEALDEDELVALAAICHEYTYDHGAVIAYQRDVANSLYIVRSGRLFAHGVDNRGIVRESRSYFPGDYFGERWLFAPDTHPATVRGAGNGRILIIHGPDFLAFLDQNPRVLNKLAPEIDEQGNVLSGLSLEAWEEATKVRVRADRPTARVNLLPDELVEYSSRRSRWYLLLRTIPPLILLLTIPPLLYIFLIAQFPEGILRWIAIGVPALLAIILFLLLLFNWLDWSNDYFVITNKHLVHREFDLRKFRITVNKIPIEQVQSVQIAKPNILTNLFNIGTARITTAAQAGTVFFDNIDRPARVREVLDRLTQRVRALNAGEVQAAMRQSLEDYFQVEPPLHPVMDEEETDTEIPETAEPNILSRLIQRYKWRTEENGVITYRKHLFVLLEQITMPLGFGLILLLVGWILIRLFQFTLPQLLLPALILFAIDIGWLVWQIEDWRNDTFQVTDRFVIDIDRRPFGFGESRKQAALANIQNVNADQPGLFPTIFNYGNVIIETAGATADITFENVPKPSLIQSDIFRKLDKFRQQQRIREGQERRKEYAVLLDVYKQATEQNRIPPRTPPPELLEEQD
ncbi:MAG: hypothetical protein D6706_19315 [Chloroflexi bacterium]|nr:MAG: hypothetical protein D6706_19315 [Chloroflexota bacterium]